MFQVECIPLPNYLFSVLLISHLQVTVHPLTLIPNQSLKSMIPLDQPSIPRIHLFTTILILALIPYTWTIGINLFKKFC